MCKLPGKSALNGKRWSYSVYSALLLTYQMHLSGTLCGTTVRILVYANFKISQSRGSDEVHFRYLDIMVKTTDSGCVMLPVECGPEIFYLLVESIS